MKILLISLFGVFFTGFLVATIRAIIGDHAKPWSVSDVAQAEARTAVEPYWHRVLVALDIFINVVFIKGQEDETISTHSWRASLLNRTWGKAMIWWLNLFQANHGQQAASGDLERAENRVIVLSKLLQVDK